MTSFNENISIPSSISSTPRRAAEGTDALKVDTGAVDMVRFLRRDVF